MYQCMQRFNVGRGEQTWPEANALGLKPDWSIPIAEWLLRAEKLLQLGTFCTEYPGIKVAIYVHIP
jgi:hypothetical protein